MDELVADEEIETFRRDGVVALRQKFDDDWLSGLREEITQSMGNPGPRLARHTTDDDAPGYYEDFWSWNSSERFSRFVHDSPAAPLAAQLLNAPTINLVMDNWFLREAGSTSRPPFHHDISYFDFAGSMCVLWLPLEDVDKAAGISFVRGSHLWGKHFMRVRFRDGHNGATSEHVTVNGVDYEPPPNIESNPGAYDLVSFDLDQGDCIFFDMRTLHGSLTTVTPTETMSRYTLRMTAPDGHIRYRGDWAIEERRIFEAAGYGEGDRLDGAFFPQLFP